MRISGIRGKMLLVVLTVVGLLFACGWILLLDIHRNNAYRDAIHAQNAAILVTTQHALSAANASTYLMQDMIFSDGLETEKSIQKKRELFEASVLNLSLFIGALNWGSESEGFRKRAHGKVWQEWVSQGWDKRVKLQLPPDSIRQLAGLADIYYSAANRYRREVLDAFRIFRQSSGTKAGIPPEIYDEILHSLQYHQKARQVLTNLIDTAEQECEASKSRLAEEQAGKFKALIIFFAVFLSAILACVLFAFTYLILSPLKQLEHGVRRLAAGDWSVRLTLATGDEFQRLAEAFNNMIVQLKETTVSRDALAKEIETRKHYEKVALQAEKMSAVGQLAAGVAHEINNPLGVILGFSQGIAKRVQPGDPFEFPVKSIEREALRCKNLVQDLLIFSRAGKGEKEPVDLKRIIELSLSLIMTKAKVSGFCNVTKEVADDLPLILANFTQIQQVILNLCDNAIDALKAGGQLNIRAVRDTLNGKDAARLEIIDDGHGIPDEIQTKIFDPFFTTKEVGKGTGLGLSLVYEIIKKHEGQISVISSQGKGTTFTVLLRAA